MIAITDFSHLKPEEAREKIVYIYHRVYAVQFHKRFLVRTLDPYEYLKFEIIAYLEGRIEEIHGWEDPLGQLKDWLYENIYKRVKAVWDDIISPTIYNWSSYIWDRVLEVKDAVGKIPEKIRDVYNKAVDIYNYVTQTIYEKLKDAWEWLKNISSTIYNKAREAVNVVWDWLVKVWNDYIKPGVSTIVSGFKWLWEQASNFAQNAVTWAQNAYNTIQNAWNDIVEQVSGKFEALTKQVGALPQAIASGFQNAISYLKDTFERIWNDVLVPFGDTIKKQLEEIGRRIHDAVSGIFDTILNALATYAPVTPEKAWNYVKIILPISIGATLAPYAVSVAGELLHPLKRIGLTDVASKINDMLSIGTIGSFVLGAVVGAAVKTPLNYFINAIFKPNLPSFGDVHNLLGRYSISEEEFKRYMAYYGLKEDYYWMYAELGTTPSPTFTLRMYARYCGVDPDLIADALSKLRSPESLDLRRETNPILAELLRMGRSVEWMRMFIQLMLKEATRQVRDQYAREILRDYEYGFIARDELENELRAMGYPEQQLRLLLNYAEIRSDRRDIEDHIKALQFSYRRGKITIEEFASGLASLGIREDKIERLVAIERARAKEEVGSTQEEEVRAYGRSTVIKRFREGMITENELENELRMLGYSKQWIERLRVVAILERDYDFAMEVLKALRYAYRKKKIDDTLFIQKLKEYGFVPEKISLELSLLKLRMGLGIEEEEVGG